MSQSKPVQRKRLSLEQLRSFVVAWTKAQSLEDLVTATGMSRSRCIATAVRLRKNGVKLKKLSGPPQIDAAEFNRLIDTTMRVQQNQQQPTRAPSPAEAIAARRAQR